MFSDSTEIDDREYEVGDLIQEALWFFVGQDTEKLGLVITSRFHETAQEYGLILDQFSLEFEYASGDDQRLPDPPKHGMTCLIGSVRVMGKFSTESDEAASFLASLTLTELEVLRRATRRVAKGYREIPPTDSECDEVIMEIGAEVAGNMLREAWGTNDG